MDNSTNSKNANNFYNNKAIDLLNQNSTVVLDTIRYRYHGIRDNYEHQYHSKPIIDLTKLDLEDIPDRIVKNVHRPLPHPHCPASFIDDKDSIFRINHYVGSWESYSFRQDSRGLEEMKRMYRIKSIIAGGGKEDTITSWIDGFLESVGYNTAIKLLNGAGVIDNKTEMEKMKREEDEMKAKEKKAIDKEFSEFYRRHCYKKDKGRQERAGNYDTFFNGMLIREEFKRENGGIFKNWFDRNRGP